MLQKYNFYRTTAVFEFVPRIFVSVDNAAVPDGEEFDPVSEANRVLDCFVVSVAWSLFKFYCIYNNNVYPIFLEQIAAKTLKSLIYNKIQLMKICKILIHSIIC